MLPCYLNLGEDRREPRTNVSISLALLPLLLLLLLLEVCANVHRYHHLCNNSVRRRCIEPEMGVLRDEIGALSREDVVRTIPAAMLIQSGIVCSSYILPSR